VAVRVERVRALSRCKAELFIMNDEVSTPSKLGIIAGNGRFPFLVLDAARERVAHALTSLVAGWDENHNR
jgi:DUF1009 family protein